MCEDERGIDSSPLHWQEQESSYYVKPTEALFDN